MNVVGMIMKFEQGETTNVETLELFSELVKSGMITSLRGSYHRQFLSLVDGQFLTPDGEITEWGRSMAEDIDEGIAEGESAAEGESDEGYDEHIEEEIRQGELAADLAEAVRAFYDDPEVFIEATDNRVRFVEDVTQRTYVIHEDGTFTETTYYADDNLTRESEGVSVQAEIDRYRDLAAEWAPEGTSTTSS